MALEQARNGFYGARFIAKLLLALRIHTIIGHESRSKYLPDIGFINRFRCSNHGYSLQVVQEPVQGH
jgi:hypothetical protein